MQISTETDNEKVKKNVPNEKVCILKVWSLETLNWTFYEK